MGANVVRRLFKGTVAELVHRSGLRKLVAAWRRSQAGGRRILIVGYHRVVEDFSREASRSLPGLLISQETFRRHLEDIHAAGYDFAPLGQALDVLAGRRAAEKDLCVVTFDDGYRDVYRYAWPVLKRLGIPSIMYVPAAMIGTSRRFNHDRLFHLIGVAQARGYRPTGDALPPSTGALLEPIFSGRKTPSAALDDFIGEFRTADLEEVINILEQQLGGGPELTPEQGDLCTWDDLRELAAGGMDLGAHTLWHTVLTLEDTASVEREVRESKALIEREVDRPVLDFAYCNGWYSDEVIRILVRHGFRSAVTTEDLSNRIGGDPFALKRKVLWENFSVGALGDYSTALIGCHLDDVFNVLGAARPIPGRRPQRLAVDPATLSFFARERLRLGEDR